MRWIRSIVSVGGSYPALYEEALLKAWASPAARPHLSTDLIRSNTIDHHGGSHQLLLAARRCFDVGGLAWWKTSGVVQTKRSSARWKDIKSSRYSEEYLET